MVPHQNSNKFQLPCPDQENWAATINNTNKSIAGWFCNDGQGFDTEHIADLIFQGIKVGDYKKALPDNIEPDAAAQAPSFIWGGRRQYKPQLGCSHNMLSSCQWLSSAERRMEASSLG